MMRLDPLPDQWFSRDFPVLREVAQRLAADPTVWVSVDDLAPELGLDVVTLSVIGGSLRDAGFVEGSEIGELPGLAYFTKLTPDGRREVGLWPSPEAAADRLIAALNHEIDRAAEGEQKTRLQTIRDGFVNAGRDLLVSVASGVITGQIGS